MWSNAFLVMLQMLANIWNATQLENFMPCNTEDCYSKLLMKYLQKRFIISLSWICIFCIFLVKKVNQVWLRSELYEGNWFIFGLPKWSKNKQNLKKIFIIWQKMCLALCEKWPHLYFWSVSSRIWTEISPYSNQMRKN